MKALAEMSLVDIGRLTEEQAREFLEGLRWPNGPYCPACRSKDVKRIPVNRNAGVRPGLIYCRECKTQFTVTVGTIFQDSHIPLDKWFLAFALMSSSKKGISALQLQRNLGLGSYRSAWFMAHRIRVAFSEGGLAELMKGTVEVDEAYVGGKPRKGGPKGGKRVGSPKPERTGRPSTKTTNKTPVVALVQRDGSVITRVVDRVTSKNLKQVIREGVHPSARIMTDEFISYRGIGKEFAGGHHTVNHSKNEYARGDVTTNSAESFFALLKRGVYGTFHHVSRTHLHRYTDEFSFRWNHRKLNDGERLVAALLGTWTRRLIYVAGF
jgi:transposase-like protein